MKILLLVFKDLDVLTLYNLRRTNKWIKFIIDCNPKLFWYKHYPIAKIKPYVYNYEYSEKYNVLMILCMNYYRINIIDEINYSYRYMVTYADDYVPPKQLIYLMNIFNVII
ncbi:Hypothetical protein ORPV_450 [Orpheovirus IHUMI-LCC2]|uniref:F-box domain-containing protein n=1 Tax=Orpheovirus IHUMI-LCC2 TaxID=2023057 RepID=A0A2I2L4A2_9VIRU|nr:Hypothetical protein ORPV_450 [Orpheovirus IHUMI-LCC2]SNW62354.1 Hypothetical protein ORPV_450 [Orpheovirus IHUMI-LCC2]